MIKLMHASMALISSK